MKKYNDIDYEQRPGSYWDDTSVLVALLRNVQGTQRRRMITDFWRQGRVEELRDELLAEKLDEATRESLSRIHPAFMGGEYLPDYEAEEAEIARIELASTTRDVISVRARRDPQGIRFRAVDECETEFDLPYEVRPRPLTLGQLIRFIDGTNPQGLSGGLALCYNEMNAEDGDREGYRHFTTVSSGFYPDLNAHYEQVYDDWVKGVAGGGKRQKRKP